MRVRANVYGVSREKKRNAYGSDLQGNVRASGTRAALTRTTELGQPEAPRWPKPSRGVGHTYFEPAGLVPGARAVFPS